MLLSTFLMADTATTDPNIWDKSTGALSESFTQAYQQVISLAPRIVAMTPISRNSAILSSST